MAIMDKARERGSFKKPDIKAFVPQGMQDTVDRIAAAGQKIMYSPDMRDELMAEVQSEEAIPLKMSKAVVGLMLTIDQQTQGGIPEEALFPAGLELLNEAADVLTQAGQQVTQEEYNEAARAMFVLMGQKLGVSDEDMMGAAEQAAGGSADPENDPDDSEPGHEQGEAPAEEQAEDAGTEPDEEEMR